MARSTRISRIGIIPALLGAISCLDDSALGDAPPAGDPKSSGYFRIILNEKSALSQGLPTVQGKVYAGPQPASILWREKAGSGGCTLYIPKAPFCDPGCGSKALCVSDGVCQDFPPSISVGRVTLTGVKTKAGQTAFTMDPVLNGYQPPAGTTLEYEPFAEGEAVSVAAAGDTGLGAFAVSGKAIARLAVLNDSFALADGKPIPLRWVPPGKETGSKITVLIDLSHHGGSKGKIECETADDGSLDIDATLLDALKALGVSGWPTIEIRRRSVATNDKVHVDLEIESLIARELGIPGLISCTSSEECPDGKTCQPDLQCK